MEGERRLVIKYVRGGVISQSVKSTILTGYCSTAATNFTVRTKIYFTRLTYLKLIAIYIFSLDQNNIFI